MLYYALADVAFVGGSLVPAGGHNVLEPACMGIPIVAGPCNYNFLEICELLKKAGSLKIVRDSEQLANQVNLLLGNAELRHNTGARGKELVESNRGSASSVMHFLDGFLNKNATSGSN